MSSARLKLAKEKSRVRKELLKHTLGVDDLGEALGSDPALRGRLKPCPSSEAPKTSTRAHSENGEGDNEAFHEHHTLAHHNATVVHHHPHNDYSQNFVDTGQRPQNFIRDAGLADRFEEYPKLRELIRLKNELISETAHPPMYLKCNNMLEDLRSLPHQFDVILIEPPLEEYHSSSSRISGPSGTSGAGGAGGGGAGASGGAGSQQGADGAKFWDWDRIMALDVGALAAQRAFVFLWCGSSEGLDLGRLCLQSWGFRRCEDICWIKTNNKGRQRSAISHQVLEPNAVLQRTKEHCLMGIKGTVRRSTDGDFIHANVDIDLIIDEEPDVPGCVDKPEEMFHIIEHFCLGRRRLQLFGRDSTVRPGWLTLGPDLTMSNYDKTLYSSYFADGNTTTGCSDRIESLRPKSPPPKMGLRGRGGGMGGRGRGRGDGRMLRGMAP